MKNTIGILIIVIGLVFKSVFDNNYENYSMAYSICIISFVIGSIIMCNEHLRKYEMLIPNSFFLNPKKWIINFGRMMMIILSIIVGSIILIEMTSLINQFVTKKVVMINSVDTVAKLEQEINIKLIGKYRSGNEKFMLISYDVNNERKLKSIKSNQLSESQREGEYIAIKYSKKYPDLFTLK